MTYKNAEQAQQWAEHDGEQRSEWLSLANGVPMEFAAKAGTTQKYSGSDEIDEVDGIPKHAKKNFKRSVSNKKIHLVSMI